MNLVIRAVSLAGAPLSQSITGYFDTRGGTIGRSDTNTMALPDPERLISRLQAEIWHTNDSFMVRNVGTANAIMHNDHRVAPGESAALVQGDELQVGAYVLKVQESHDNETVRTITRGRVVVEPQKVIASSATEGHTDPRQGALAQAAAQVRAAAAAPMPNPFADLLGSPAMPHPVAPSRSTAGAPARVPAPVAAAGFASAPPTRLPDDFDPFADPVPAAPAHDPAGGLRQAAGLHAAAAARPPSGRGADGFDLLGSISPAPSGMTLDALFNLKPPPAGTRDPLDDFLAPRAAEGARAATSLDPLELLGGHAPAAEPRPAPYGAAFDHTPDVAGAYTPPRVMPDLPSAETIPAARLRMAMQEQDATSLLRTLPPVTAAARAPARPASDVPPPAPARPAAQPPAAAPGQPATHEELWAAFSEGAGVALEPPQGLTPELMRLIGTLLRQSMEGTRRLVAARAATKQELRAEVTIVQSRHNNPLKFAPDGQAALEQLLQPPLRGFLPAAEAVADVMDDLLGHAIGTMAGTRAALDGVLARFVPDQLEAKLVGRSMLDTLVPMNRRAKLWELYLQHFDKVRAEAQDDFHNLFGRAFLQAYEQQLDRLHAERDRP
jgi:FHA domain-containing protein